MSSGTLKRFTASNSFGTYRMRLLWETAIRPFLPAVLQPLFVAAAGKE